MSDYRELIDEEQGVGQSCHCQSCGSKAGLQENPKGTLWYKCTECGWFGLKYSGNDSQNEYVMDMTDIKKYTKIAEDCGFGIIPTKLEIKDKCEYCEVDVDDRKPILERYDNDCYFEYFYIDENNHLTNGDIVHDKINYCPMCGRKL